MKNKIKLLILVFLIVMETQGEFMAYSQDLNNKSSLSNSTNKSNSRNTYRKSEPRKIEGVMITKVNEGRLHGYFYTPDNMTKEGIIVVVGGSSGDYSFNEAEILSSRGYNVFCLAYIRETGLPDYVKEVPLDIMDDFFSYCDKNEISYKPLSMIGTSMGTCFIEALVKYYDQIDNIVLFAPSNVDVGGFGDKDNFSKWTFRGEKLLPSSYKEFDRTEYEKLKKKKEDKLYSQRPLYEFLLNNIKVKVKYDLSSLKGQIILFAGDDDKMGPSDVFAKEIYEDYKDKTELHIFEGAGHTFRPIVSANGVSYGGSKDKNYDAYKESKELLLEFLSKYHN